MGQRVSGFERKDGDEYMTPQWVAETLCYAIPMYGTVWEPACGEGAIARAIYTAAHINVFATDLDSRHSTTYGPLDFLGDVTRVTDWFEGPLTIVTNPPYGKGGRLAQAFVRRALELTEPSRGRVAMLLPVAWDAACTRQHLFEDFPHHITKITLTERIRWTNLPQSKNGPSENHAWYIWNWAGRGRDHRWLGRVRKEAAQ